MLIQAIKAAHQGAVRGLAWTNKYMISAGFRDGLVRLWDIESHELHSQRQTWTTAIWLLVGGEGKIAAASKLDENKQILDLWDSDDIDEGHL